MIPWRSVKLGSSRVGSGHSGNVCPWSRGESCDCDRSSHSWPGGRTVLMGTIWGVEVAPSWLTTDKLWQIPTRHSRQSEHFLPAFTQRTVYTCSIYYTCNTPCHEFKGPSEVKYPSNITTTSLITSYKLHYCAPCCLLCYSYIGCKEIPGPPGSVLPLPLLHDAWEREHPKLKRVSRRINTAPLGAPQCNTTPHSAVPNSV